MFAEHAPCWFWNVPDERRVERFLEAQRKAAVSYAEVGETRDDAVYPRGYNIDHNRVWLGHGEAVFERARVALSEWRMFPAPWTKISPVGASQAEGQTIAMQARAMSVWWLNACRIVYVVDEMTGGVRRWGFAYGTLPAHVEQGEERFSVEWRSEDDSAWYDLRAFSRPRYWPVRLAKPMARRLQRRFVRDSLAAMRAAVSEGVAAETGR